MSSSYIIIIFSLISSINCIIFAQYDYGRFHAFTTTTFLFYYFLFKRTANAHIFFIKRKKYTSYAVIDDYGCKSLNYVHNICIYICSPLFLYRSTFPDVFWWVFACSRARFIVRKVAHSIIYTSQSIHARTNTRRKNTALL